MRGRDDETGEFLAPSRSQQRREALDVLTLAQSLAELDPGKLAKLPVPADLLPHVAEARRITSHIARKRQMAYLAKQLRRQEDATLDAIRDALDAGGAAAREETALLHRAERWRDRLLDEGDAALGALLDEHPGADRQRLRALVRNAAEERAKAKPPRSYRELFRELRDVLKDGAADPDADPPDTDRDDAAG